MAVGEACFGKGRYGIAQHIADGSEILHGAGIAEAALSRKVGLTLLPNAPI